jgi:hypothetical protein
MFCFVRTLQAIGVDEVKYSSLPLLLLSHDADKNIALKEEILILLDGYKNGSMFYMFNSCPGREE